MALLAELVRSRSASHGPFLVGRETQLSIGDLQDVRIDLSAVSSGDVVAVIGDFDAVGIASLLMLFDRGAIVMPLVSATSAEHEYFLEAGGAQFVLEKGRIVRTLPKAPRHRLLGDLRQRGHAGLILFSSGTTGRPKAILHDFELFLRRYRTPRPSLRTLSFLQFDHIGGINTLMHTLFNNGVIVVPSGRGAETVLQDIAAFSVALLPTTPTFLRMLLLSQRLGGATLRTLRVITYGTERMDQATLDALADALPDVDFRQTYGMSELGILRAKSRDRRSLWMKIGGEGVSVRVEGGVLHLMSEQRMLGYLNAPSPFVNGWYDTGDLVEEEGEYLKIVGRTKEVINVGGLKVLPAEIERVALLHADIAHASASGVRNPITGQHIEVLCEPRMGRQLDKMGLREHFIKHLPPQFVPQRITVGVVPTTHRHKRAGARDPKTGQ